jgi:hypothetical protein
MRRALQQTPDGRPAIAVAGTGSDWVSSLEGEVLLDAVYRREIVVLDLAELQEATRETGNLSLHSAISPLYDNRRTRQDSK